MKPLAIYSSKGRKMNLIESMHLMTNITTKTFRGNKVEQEEKVYLITITTDYGVTFKTLRSTCYPSTSYIMPDGSKTANMWDLYEHFKK